MCFRANKEGNALAKEIQSENLSFLRIQNKQLLGFKVILYFFVNIWQVSWS